MSAFLCSENHLNTIVNAHPTEANESAFKMLLAENLRSLEERYPGRDFLDEWIEEAKTFKFAPRNDSSDPTQVVKACDCYDYQACETDDYETTPAAEYIKAVRAAALLAGGESEGERYDAVEWAL